MDEELRANRPDLDPRKIQRIRELMDRHVDDSVVVGHMDRVSSLELPDPDDRHVLAAAIHSGARTIVTKNLKDFPASILGGFGVEARHPDDFLVDLIEAEGRAVCLAARAVRGRLRNPPKSAEEYLLTLEQQELPKTVAILRDSIELI